MNITQQLLQQRYYSTSTANWNISEVSENHYWHDKYQNGEGSEYDVMKWFNMKHLILDVVGIHLNFFIDAKNMHQLYQE